MRCNVESVERASVDGRGGSDSAERADHDHRGGGATGFDMEGVQLGPGNAEAGTVGINERATMGACRMRMGELEAHRSDACTGAEQPDGALPPRREQVGREPECAGHSTA